jgi:alkylation response protein AidB-like acyl-CoA dehydrogenase
LFALLIELSAADSNVTQGLRGHFGFVEDILRTPLRERRALWLPRIARGDFVGNARSEIGEAKATAFATRLTLTADGLRLTGQKYYTTGSYFADWIDVGATDDDGNGIGATVGRHMQGVTVIDDWDGFGQMQTASGTARFEHVAVEPESLAPDKTRPKYYPAFFQTVHLATLTGIGRAMAAEASRLVAERRRTYTHANGPRAAQDPQVLQVIGRVRSAAYCSRAIVLHAAAAIERTFALRGSSDEAAEDRAVAEAELEVCQSVTIVSDLILNAATDLFDALGASATSRKHGLDRYWRNARTLASHNPRIYKDRIVGDYAVNGTLPPPQWRIGLPEAPMPADSVAGG